MTAAAVLACPPRTFRVRRRCPSRWAISTATASSTWRWRMAPMSRFSLATASAVLVQPPIFSQEDFRSPSRLGTSTATASSTLRSGPDPVLWRCFSETAAAVFYVGPADVAFAINGIAFTDADGYGEVATFTAAQGTLAALGGNGVVVGGSGSATLTLTGSIADLNAFIAANHLNYTHTGQQPG